jgi:hypothetical protein
LLDFVYYKKYICDISSEYRSARSVPGNKPGKSADPGRGQGDTPRTRLQEPTREGQPLKTTQASTVRLNAWMEEDMARWYEGLHPKQEDETGIWYVADENGIGIDSINYTSRAKAAERIKAIVQQARIDEFNQAHEQAKYDHACGYYD